MNEQCLICSAETVLIKDQKTDKHYLYCTRCKFIRLTARSFLSEAEERKRYRLHDCSMNDPGYVAIFEEFIDQAIKPFIQPGNTRMALDFGSGPDPNPVLPALLSRLGFRTVHYDKFFHPDSQWLSQPSQYHLITMTEVVEHLRQPQQQIPQLMRLLCPDGILALMTRFHPVRRPVKSETDAFLNWWYRRDPTHISFFSPESIAHLADIHGGQVVFCDQIKMAVLKINQQQQNHLDIKHDTDPRRYCR